MRSATPDEAAELLDAARSVIIVPGYGMAVAQAQHKVHELSDPLGKRGIDVRFAIHTTSSSTRTRSTTTSPSATSRSWSGRTTW